MKSKPNRLKLEYPAPPESPIVSLAANKVCTDMYSTCGKIPSVTPLAAAPLDSKNSSNSA
eukprot:CAMPEP_0117825642 /NCGR_PEP_ID=MMETSP0949-20121206/5606_1 /TAXON_ID=44440 /ORGANISM="Chattonella subsalsa, Strain CCMP2191" /LENGTH=59 /DNA_ID=CAMNT_0005665669 /DNA_START=89 /DNA_END=268 /DNA_ORIENTATION=+